MTKNKEIIKPKLHVLYYALKGESSHLSRYKQIFLELLKKRKISSVEIQGRKHGFIHSLITYKNNNQKENRTFINGYLSGDVFNLN